MTLWAVAAGAQDSTPLQPVPQQPAPTTGHRGLDCSVYTGMSYSYDSNIDHSQPGLETFGGLAGLGADCHFGSSSSRTLALEYDGVFRQYAKTDVWDVPGHDMKVDLAGIFAGHMIVGSTLEVAINGSPEDRVLRNEYSAAWLLGYRFNRSTRVQSYAEYLVKRYPAPQAHSELDPRVGVQFIQRFGERLSWALSGRYEENHADSSRFNYRGPTFEADLTLPLWPSARIESSAKYRIRNFSSRLIKVDTAQALRRDSDFVATAAWHQSIGRWEVVLGYRYERFQSNDIRRLFVEHIANMTLNFWW